MSTFAYLKAKQPSTMKKNILFWMGLLCASFAWAGASTNDITNPSFADTHAANTICEDDTHPTFRTTNTGDEYLWYKQNETTGVYKYFGSTRGDNTYTPSTAGKYLCKVYTNGSTSSTGNLLTAGTFNFDCGNMTRYDGDDGIYVKDGITYRFKKLICNANDGTYPGGFTCIKDKASNVKPSHFEFVQSDADPTHGYDGTNILVCDGMNSSNFKVWEATGLNITQGVTYQFSCYVANIDKVYDTRPNTLPKLSFYIEVNGVKTLLSSFSAPTTKGRWSDKKFANYTATSTGTCTIYIINHTTEDDGNDFALDDIFFGTTTSTGGSEVYESFELQIDSKPTITMPAAPEPCLNDPISITPTVSNAGTNPTYAWTGDATGSDLTLSTTAPATEGPTSYTLTVTNGACDATESINVTTQDCGITINHTGKECLDREFSLTATTQGDSYTWILPDNTTSTETSNTLTTKIARGGDNTAVRTYTCIVNNATAVTPPTTPTTPTTTLGPNLIDNSGFETTTFTAGQYSGFTSDYNIIDVNGTFYPKSNYDPITGTGTPSGNGYVRIATTAIDNTTYPSTDPNGGNYFLEIDGDFRNSSTDPYLAEYEAILNNDVLVGAFYQLSFIANSTCSSDLPNISVVLKQGTNTYTILPFTEISHGTWKEYKVENWQSPVSGAASIAIINNTPTHSGNDYVIDNITFQQVLGGYGAGTSASPAGQASGSGLVKEIFHITPEDCKMEDEKEIQLPEGQSYEFGGMSITTSGYYSYEDIADDGTRNIHQLYLVIQPTITDYICQNEPYDKNGFHLSSRQTANTGLLETENTVKSKATGCEHIDSTTTLKLTILPTYERVINDTISQGRTYDKYGFNIKTNNKKGGEYEYTLSLTTQITPESACACDSIVNLVLTIYEPIIPMAFFSPNDDNNNDLWLIAGFDMYPDAYVQIFDRFHRLLATFKGDEFKGWDGNYNGHQMPMDDYWYVITVPDRNQQISGHFTLKR